MRFCPLLLAAVFAEEELPDSDVSLSTACSGVRIENLKYHILRSIIKNISGKNVGTEENPICVEVVCSTSHMEVIFPVRGF